MHVQAVSQVTQCGLLAPLLPLHSSIALHTTQYSLTSFRPSIQGAPIPYTGYKH